MNRPVVLSFNLCRVVIYCLAEDVENTSEAAVANRNRNSAASVDSLHSTYHAIGGRHSYCTYYAVAEVLHGFADDIYRNAAVVIFDVNRVINCRKIIVVVKCNINYRTDDLDDLTYLRFLFICHEEAFLLKNQGTYSSAFAPPTISEISLVI